ncbi:hypothetical protein D9756_004758 [Leucocoprinus leucothites]|uniref:SP-RING-type domain-containing protein n=1 Tax=Leucocoprinus leucothites TaxID=201217 RepID=A0A8H5G9I6_9AGAR|nr:hypothetical protein D9756_004758 [Leucoagaricus leucothites]
MPTASSRRKPTRRNDMEDIEDDATTQRATQDAVEESDEEPTTHRAKKSKGKQRAQQEVDNDPDSDSDQAIDVENFPNQPLKRDQMRMLQGIADDWQKLADIISRPFDKYGMAAGALADLDDDDAKVRVQEIDGYMRESLDFAAVINTHTDVLNKIRQKGLQGEQFVDIGDIYIQEAKANVGNYKKKTIRQKYAREDAYIAFKSNVWEAQHPGMPMPPITEQLPREQGDNSDEDDDLEVGGVSQNYLCPVTLTLLDDPYTSSVCGHSFSAAAIRSTFRSPSALNKCPAAGCNKSFRLVDCKPNKDLAKKVKAYKRRMEKERELSDAEEVVD